MAIDINAQHAADVKRGERFQFGKNWRRFLSSLSDERIRLAEESLQRFLGADRLDGKTFLDVGSGSGLFSLAARRLGAKVRSFDYDPNSVACTNELRRRYFHNDDSWTTTHGSILDHDFVASLGEFDVVYSWGVLHHTGAMWLALDIVKPLVKLGGQLYIAIYNDLGMVTDGWRKIKRTYNQVPSIFRWPYALSVILPIESRTILLRLRSGELKSYLREWTDYSVKARGMNRWYDWIDWIGGYPYECATVEQIVDFYGKDGFVLECLGSRASGTGCNEFVFRREAGLGQLVNNPLPESRFLLRQYGSRLSAPYAQTSVGYLAKLPHSDEQSNAASLILFRDGDLIGAAQTGDTADTIIVAPPDWTEKALATTRFDVVHGSVRQISAPLHHYAGYMYGFFCPDLMHLADNSGPPGNRSPVFVFEGQKQLGFPHSIHDDIVRYGGGRFSHWGQEILFSTSDNSDPRTNERTYHLVIAQASSRHDLGMPKMITLP
jgi:2-polyprenyl-3-methyl-5-hydroxy-6-metoxy-1,4-benzoquinol methylase